MKKWLAILSGVALAGMSQGQTLVDAWYYDGVPDGTLLNGANCGSVSNLNANSHKWKHNGTPATVQNEEQEWTSGNVADESAFKNITPSSGNIIGGKIQWSYDITSADFSITAASNGTMNAGYFVRGKSGSGAYDAGIRLRYEGRLNVTNIVGGVTNSYPDADQFQIQVRSLDLGGWRPLTNFFGSTLTENLNLRTVYDIDADTFEAYFTLGSDDEVHLHTGTLQSDWTGLQMRQAFQSINGGNSWQPGDTLTVDNIELHTLASAPPPPPYALIDLWNYDGVADGSSLSAGSSTGYIGNVSFGHADIAMITNEMVQWTRFNILNTTNESAFRTAAPSIYGGATTGIYELAWDYVSSDFSNSAVSNDTGNVGMTIRDTANGNVSMGFRLRFDGTDHILQMDDASGINQKVATFPGSTLSNLSVRLVMDLDNSGSAGSAALLYSLDGGVEIGEYNRTVHPGFELSQYRLIAQTTNGDNSWQLGDKMFTDNLKFEKVAAMPVAPVFSSKVVYEMNDTAGTDLDALAQTGSDSGQFGVAAFNVTANGSGSLEFLGDTTNDVIRSHILDVAYTSGLHRLEFAFDDWDLSASEHSTKVQFGFRSDDLVNIVQFGMDVNTNNGTVRFRAAANNGGGAGQDFYDHAGYVASTGVVLRIDANLDSGLYSAYWRYDNQTDDDFVAVVAGGSLGGMSDIAQIRLMLSAGNNTGMDPADFVDVDYLRYSTTSEQAPPTPTELWNAWLAAYPTLGTSTNFSDNPDGDAYDNLSEYYYGGDPTVGGTIDGVPALGDQLSDGGTNYILYVFTRRQDSAERGLSNTIELKDNLQFGSWTNNTSLYEFVGAENVDDTWRSITNRVNAEADARFIRNQINYTP